MAFPATLFLVALFREHVTAGAVVAMGAVIVVYYWALMTDTWMLAVLFGVTLIGSFLPDVDSDSGIPFYIIYGSATLLGTGLVLLYVLQNPPANVHMLYGIPLAAFFFFWFILGGFIKRCTNHRGIFHSIPMLALSGFGTLYVATRFGIQVPEAYLLGVGMALGFATHLLLDEMHSVVTMDGSLFRPKRSLGTALKFFSNSRAVNAMTYTCLAAMVYVMFYQ